MTDMPLAPDKFAAATGARREHVTPGVPG